MRKRKYDTELIIKIEKKHIEQGISSRQLSTQYSIHHGIIEEWVVVLILTNLCFFFAEMLCRNCIQLSAGLQVMKNP